MAAPTDYVVIFGAAVGADGRPSGSLERRVAGALAWWHAHRDVHFLPTGGIGRHGPAEAAVMRDMLIAAGVAPARITLEDKARDTLESVRLCDRILRARGDAGAIICCTSPYHQLRCTLLFRMLGYTVIVPPMPSDRAALPAAKYWRFRGKELLSAPYDMIQLALRRRPAGIKGGHE
ncbi:MAG TPA: YdcF family protein [Sphingomonas sp.]|nr:YdcF family protein [Sphingomonas sp.]